MATGTNKKLFIPRKNTQPSKGPANQNDQDINWRSLEDWANNQAVPTPPPGGALFQSLIEMSFTNLGSSPSISTILTPIQGVAEATNTLTSLPQLSDGGGLILSSVSLFGPTYSTGSITLEVGIYVTDITGANTLLIVNSISMASGYGVTGTTGWTVITSTGVELSLGSPQSTNLIETTVILTKPYFMQLQAKIGRAHV